jgi:hypothetical protein
MLAHVSNRDSDRGRFCQFHRAFELRWIFVDPKILSIELSDAFHVIAGEPLCVGRFGELDNLLFVVDVRQG